MKQLEQFAKGKRIIFTVTTGRSGTMLLANLLKLVPGIIAEHEPRPLFSDIFWRLRTSPDIIYDFIISKKRAIERILKQDGIHTYVETCHLACKGFLEIMLRMGIEFELIYLMRPHREVATSLYELDDIPGRTRTGLRYYLHPENSNNNIIIRDWRKLTHYQLCYWYCLEMAERAQKYYATKTKTGEPLRVTSVSMS